MEQRKVDARLAVKFWLVLHRTINRSSVEEKKSAQERRSPRLASRHLALTRDRFARACPTQGQRGDNPGPTIRNFIRFKGRCRTAQISAGCAVTGPNRMRDIRESSDATYRVDNDLFYAMKHDIHDICPSPGASDGASQARWVCKSGATVGGRGVAVSY